MTVTATITRDFGALTITTWTDHDGISIQVFSGPTRLAALSATFLHTEREAAITWYRTIRDAALARTPIWLIEAQVSALIDAAQAVAGADAELAADINATLDAAQAELTAAHEQEQAAVADILADLPTTGGWNALRQQYRPVRPTKTNTHVQPLTAAMLARMRRHHNGIVTCAPGQPWTLLDGIVQRGHGTVHTRYGRKVTAVRLNQRGWAAIGEQAGAAA